MPAQQCEINKREYVVNAVMVLGNAKRPTQLSTVSPSVGAGELLDRVNWNPGNGRTPSEGPRLDRSGVIVEARGRVLDECTIGETGVNDLPGNGVGKGDVGADIEAAP